MITLLLHPRYDEDSQRIWAAALSRGWYIERATYEDVPKADVLYGGYMWGAQVAEKAGIKLMSPPERWWEIFSANELQRSSIGVIRYCELVAASSNDWPKFIKSLYGKSIESRVYFSLADLPPGIDPEEQFIQSYPITFLREWRAFVLGGDVRTFSPYATHGNLDIDDCPYYDLTSDARRFASMTAGAHIGELPESYVMDVGQTADGFAVVELNPAWCSGLYACSAEQALDIIAASCSLL